VTTQGQTYWSRVGEEWLATARQRLWRTHHDAVVRAWLTRWLAAKRATSVLKTDLFEEAIGDGVIPMTGREGTVIVGIDVSASVVWSASRHRTIGAVQADIRQSPFADGSFDCVVTTSTLDHFDTSDELHRSVVELVRILRPSGELLITLDNLSNPVVRLRNALPGGPLRRLGLVPYRVGASCNRQGLCYLLENAGTTVTDITAILHCPRVLMVPIARLTDRLSPHGRLSDRLLRFLDRWETMERWPSRFVTGYYLAARAVKR
jgi:SAM-dependent methyltransferase